MYPSHASTYLNGFQNNIVAIQINMWIPILIIAALLILLTYKGTKKPKCFPPGPPRLPVIGSLPYILTRSDPSEPPSLMTGILQGLRITSNVSSNNMMLGILINLFFFGILSYQMK